MRWKTIGALVLTLIVFASQAYGYRRAVKSIRLIPWGRTMISASDPILLDMVRASEGFRPKPYTCPSGAWTIGYGYNMEAHGVPGDMVRAVIEGKGITKERAEKLMMLEIAVSLDWAKRIFPNFAVFSDNRQRVIVDMIFNMGPSGFQSFKQTIPLMCEGLWDQAAKNILASRYAKQVKGRAVRNAEMLRNG